MPAIQWILYREKVVGRNSPKYVDVDNRPVRQLVELHGWDPDDPNFEGLHHFPDGLHTNDIFEQTLGSGIGIHADAGFDGDVIIDGNFTLNGAAVHIEAIGDFVLNLHTNDLLVDGGNIRLTNGVFFGNIDVGRIVTSLTIGNDVGDPPGAINAVFRVAENGTFTVDSIHDATIRFLKLKTEAVNYAPGRVWTEHYIGNLRWVSMDTTPGAEVLYNWTDGKKVIWTTGIGTQLIIDGTAAGDGLIVANVIAEFHNAVKLFYDLFGGRTLKYDAIGSAGIGKRTVYVDD